MSELEIFRQQNFGNPIGFGRRSALLVVDFTVGFNDPALFGGGNIDPAVKRTVRLLEFFRARKLPVALTRVVYADDGSDGGIFATKQPRLLMLTERHPAGQVVPELAPRAGELVVRKNQASSFFGTNLAPWLVQQGADTVVVLDGDILEKPASPDEALAMLRRLRGRWHAVHTGVALVDGAQCRRAVGCERTDVRFHAWDDAFLGRYVATGECLDKAGAYAIQGLASKFIDRIEGCYFNVVGLPLSLLYRSLIDFGWSPE